MGFDNVIFTIGAANADDGLILDKRCVPALPPLLVRSCDDGKLMADAEVSFCLDDTVDDLDGFGLVNLNNHNGIHYF